MHEGRRPKCRLAGIADVGERRNVRREPVREADRQLAEQIVRVLAVVQRLVVPRFAGLK